MFTLYLVLLCLVLLAILVGGSCKRPKNFPPGPRLLPLIGNLLYYSRRYKALGFHHLIWAELAEKYGSIIGLKLGRSYVVTVMGPEAVKEVLSREEFDGRPDGYFFRLRTFGKRLGILFADGQFWRKQRKFSLQHLRTFGFGCKEMEEKIHEECVALVESLKAKSNEPIFMHRAFDVSVLNALWAMLAGVRFDVNDARLTELLHILHDCFRIVDISGGLINQMPILRFVAPDATGYNQFLDVLNRMWTFLQETIEEHRRTIPPHPRDLIDAFLKSMEVKVDDSFTDDQLVSLCLDLFMAGAETTSNILGFTSMYMVLYPEVQRKVQKELDAVVGRDRWPTIKDKPNLTYTQAVLLEILRRTDLAPMSIAHRATKDTQLMGYDIAEDTIILTNLHSVHMNEEVYENPEEFLPERFIGGNGRIVVNEKTFIPFGFGKRRCLGEVLAKTNMFLFFTSLLHNFTLEAVKGFYPDVVPYDGVTLSPRPFKVKLIIRNLTTTFLLNVLVQLLPAPVQKRIVLGVPQSADDACAQRRPVEVHGGGIHPLVSFHVVILHVVDGGGPVEAPDHVNIIVQNHGAEVAPGRGHFRPLHPLGTRSGNENFHGGKPGVAVKTPDGIKGVVVSDQADSGPRGGHLGDVGPLTKHHADVATRVVHAGAVFPEVHGWIEASCGVKVLVAIETAHNENFTVVAAHAVVSSCHHIGVLGDQPPVSPIIVSFHETSGAASTPAPYSEQDIVRDPRPHQGSEIGTHCCEDYAVDVEHHAVLAPHHSIAKLVVLAHLFPEERELQGGGAATAAPPTDRLFPPFDLLDVPEVERFPFRGHCAQFHVKYHLKGLVVEIMYSAVLSFLLGLALLGLFLLKECVKPKKFPRGPPWIPFIGNGPELRRLAKLHGGQHLALINLSRKYHTQVLGLKLGKERVACVCSYATVRHVLTSDQFQGRPDNFFFKLRCLGSRNGITGTEGDLWKEQRTFLVSHLRVLGFGKSSMEKMVKTEIREIIGALERAKGAMELSSMLPISVLNILWCLTSGKSLKDNERIQKLLGLMEKRTQAFDMSGGTLNNYPWMRFVAPEKTGYNLMVNVNAQIKDFIMEAIEEHKRSWTAGRGDDFIYYFLSEMAKVRGQQTTFTEQQLVMVCLDIFIAGSTTTSNTIDFAFLAMILFPEVQQRVHQCLDSEFKKKEDVFYCDRQRVPYIEAVLLECQRYFPVVPVIGPRRALVTTTIDEYVIPKDTTVLLNLHSVHHDKTFWKDPEVFRPERFLDKDGALKAHDRVMTFGLGKRRCLGDALAKSCIFLFFVEILRNFQIERDASAERPSGKPIPGMTMTPEKYKARFVPKV
ncbi:uncharacterized protein LOC126747190 [Anthonomus grandis grandis]|uniref:uncharacterized protein LOC126747190 n=1 Tax=Anthonomus grandis grandis TaxID=2921223 RepID=UPI002165BF51|nr:uncharacterized protein LOC126747190 [Anthonomus grandis grandis]